MAWAFSSSSRGSEKAAASSRLHQSNRGQSQPSSNWYGVYQPNAWASNDVVLNIAKMDSVSHYAQLQVMAHEFGHSVGLADHSVSSGRCSYLMGSGCPADGWPRTLQTHDLEDLDFIGLR